MFANRQSKLARTLARQQQSCSSVRGSSRAGLRRKRTRRGIASVEFAVVFPILMLLVLGTIEVCQRLFLRQTATVVAYEGVRLAARRTSTAAEVASRCNALFEDRRISGAEVTVTPANFDNIETGTPITIEIEIPWSENSSTRFVLRDQGHVVVRATMLRE